MWLSPRHSIPPRSTITPRPGISGIASAVGSKYRLHGIKDPLLFLWIFFHGVRTGVVSVKRKSIQKRSVEQYICSVVQIFAAVGGVRPQIQQSGINQLLLGTKTCGLQERRPSAKNIMTPSDIHTANSWRQCQSSYWPTTSYFRHWLGLLIIPYTTRLVIQMRYQHSFNPLLPTRHLIICGTTAPPIHL